MSSVNRVILVGRLGKDPEINFLQSGGAVANASLATSEKYTKNGEKVEQTEWHRLSFFGKLAEIVGQYVVKGSLIYVEGKIRTDQYTDKQTGEVKYSTSIICERLQMLGGGQNNQNQPQQKQEGDYGKASGRSTRPVPVHELDDDIPF